MKHYLFTLCLLVSLSLSSCDFFAPVPTKPSAIYGCIPATKKSLAEPSVMFSSSFEKEVFYPFKQGEQGSFTVNLKLSDPDGTICDGVVTFNVVNYSTDNIDLQQKAHVLFDPSSAKQEPAITNTAFSAKQLETGLSSSSSFKFLDNAPVGKYALVFQCFSGTQTDPAKVKQDNKFCHQRYLIEVVAK